MSIEREGGREKRERRRGETERVHVSENMQLHIEEGEREGDSM